MKKFTHFTKATFVLLLSLTYHANAQEFKGLDVSPMDAASYPTSSKVSDKLIKVIYSRPQLKGRSLSQLTPNGKVWRTGANEATDVIVYKDMKLDGKEIKAGEYSLFTIPGDTEWTIILSKDINVWGAYSYNEANDVIRVKARVTTSDESLEAFSITFDKNGTMYMGWGTVRVAIPFSM
ncbi:hypothetical protein GCM10007962_29440 [Yeosuana aromativorans]|uniref:Asparagine synthetase B n=1 Tax=Yeosuana aromativorans TaxID=288019 RepID=A0A8J3BSW8_9FLAO|nr:DUF2911 domain-containing protein [Yeosuana aromativorans]GGK33185.1 hypothetical protein GCM10007962_29440 [Yeosuana aromativorans]